MREPEKTGWEKEAKEKNREFCGLFQKLPEAGSTQISQIDECRVKIKTFLNFHEKKLNFYLSAWRKISFCGRNTVGLSVFSDRMFRILSMHESDRG